MFSQDATVCGHTKHVLGVRVCSVSTTFTARHRWSLFCDRSHIETASAAKFALMVEVKVKVKSAVGAFTALQPMAYCTLDP
jgi:hypothetical protein